VPHNIVWNAVLESGRGLNWSYVRSESINGSTQVNAVKQANGQILIKDADGKPWV
jgi:hypothetical protein